MSTDGRSRSIGQRVYDRLFKIFGPAQVSEAESALTDVSENERASAERLVQWEKETRDGRTYLVRKPPES